MNGPSLRMADLETRQRGGSDVSASARADALVAGRQLPTPRRRTRPRVSWRALSFAVVVVLPAAAAGTYLYGFASDQYVSEFRFRLRHARPVGMEQSPGLAGLSVSGAGMMTTAVDSQIVVQYMTSRQMIDDLAPAIDVDRVYGRPDADWLARLETRAPREARQRYWSRVVDPFYDFGNTTVTVKVRAFAPAEAHRVADAVLDRAERLVNGLSERAHADAIAFATREMADKEAKLRRAEAALRDFRNQHRILFPAAQASSSATVDTTLQTQLAQARSTYEASREQGMAAGAPQLLMAQRRIAALETEASRLQSGLASAAQGAEIPLASVLSDYDALEVDGKIAEKNYESASAALQRANEEAGQQQIYLDAYVRPAEPQMSLYPVRWRLTLETALGSLALWCLGTLLVLAVRDHMD